MKNKYRKLAVIMLTAVCFAGCQQEDIVYPEPDAKVFDLKRAHSVPSTSTGTRGNLYIESDI